MNPDTYAQRVPIIVSSGPNAPTRCAAPFRTATLLACMDVEVTLFLNGRGMQLARRTVADQLRALDSGEPLRRFIRQARETGARLLMCRQPGVNIDESKLIEKLDEIFSGGELARLILESERVLTL